MSFKLFERLLLRRVEPVLNPQLPDKQAGFRHCQYKTDQVFKQTYDVEHRFEENKSGIVLADLTAAHEGLLRSTRANHPAATSDLPFLLQSKF